MRLVFGSAKVKTEPVKSIEPEWEQSFVLTHHGKDKQVSVL